MSFSAQPSPCSVPVLQLRVPEEEPHFLPERDPEDDREGPPGAVWNLGGSSFPAGSTQAVTPPPGWNWLLAPLQRLGRTAAPHTDQVTLLFITQIGLYDYFLREFVAYSQFPGWGR